MTICDFVFKEFIPGCILGTGMFFVIYAGVHLHAMIFI